MSRRPMAFLLAIALAAAPMAHATDMPQFQYSDEVATLPAYGPLSYQPLADCQPAYCAEFLMTAEMTTDAQGGSEADSNIGWIVVGVLVGLMLLGSLASNEGNASY